MPGFVPILLKLCHRQGFRHGCELAGGSSCVVFADGGNPEKVFHMLILVLDEHLVTGLPGVECLPQGDRT